MKARSWLPALLSIVPLLGFLWLMLYAYVAFLQAGHWPPVYGRPDPTNIRPWIAGYILMGILMMFMIASPLALIALVWSSSRGALRAPTSRDKLHGWAALFGQLSVFGLSSVLFVSELLQLETWLVD